MPAPSRALQMAWVLLATGVRWPRSTSATVEVRHMTYRERALSFTRARGIARARDFKTAGIPLVYLKRLTDSGDLVRLGRGLY